MAFLCHGPSPTGPPLLPLSTKNPLDHVSAVIRPKKLYFGDLDLHGTSANFFLGVNRSCPGTTSTANQLPYKALVQVHGP
jgi:hypothetical protein